MKKRLVAACVVGVAAGLGTHATAAEFVIRAGGEAVPFVSPMPASGASALDSDLVFSFTEGAGMAALRAGNAAEMALADSVAAGFEAAADLWRMFLGDAVTVEVTIDFAPLGPGVLGGTSNSFVGTTYSNVAAVLGADVTTARDTTATANLQPGPGLDLIANDTDAPGAPRVRDNDGSANNVNIVFPKANAKAMGFTVPAGPDASITFSSNFPFDFDRSDGIDFDKFDFIAVAAHEIGHALGFVSGVDIVDLAGPSAPDFLDDAMTIPNTLKGADLNTGGVYSVLDLFRLSEDSLDEASPPSNGAVIDGAFAGTPFFSIDAGTTAEALFSTGRFNGDGEQASHWKDSLGIGLMDPTLTNGELGMITERDIRAFDAIGWDPIPEPATAGVLCVAAGSFIGRRNRRGN